MIVIGKLTYILVENWTLLELFLDVWTVEIQTLLYRIFSRSFFVSYRGERVYKVDECFYASENLLSKPQPHPHFIFYKSLSVK